MSAVAHLIQESFRHVAVDPAPALLWRYPESIYYYFLPVSVATDDAHWAAVSLGYPYTSCRGLRGASARGPVRVIERHRLVQRDRMARGRVCYRPQANRPEQRSPLRSSRLTRIATCASYWSGQPCWMDDNEAIFK